MYKTILICLWWVEKYTSPTHWVSQSNCTPNLIRYIVYYVHCLRIVFRKKLFIYSYIPPTTTMSKKIKYIFNIRKYKKSVQIIVTLK